MADSTAFIDTTSTFDATSYIYVDDSTSAVTAAESAQAQSLVNDFNAAVGPMEKQGKEAERGFNDIINDLSKLDPTDYTPEAVMNAYTQNALDQAYSTVGWQQGVDGLRQANVIATQCSLFDASSTPKYGDLARQISSMRSGVLNDTVSAIDKVGDDIKDKAGTALAESAIGKKLSGIANTGASKTDGVKTSNSSPVSAVLETGKAGMAKAQSVMSKLAGPMQALDKMLECTNAVGGADFAGPVDDMIDKTQNLYQKMYMFDDPSDPRYGEFNQGAFANSIPTVPKRVLDNTFKAANMFNKSENNSNLSTDRLIKQAKEGAKSTSSLSPNGENQSNDVKRTMAEDLTKVQISFPSVPSATGRSSQPSGSVSAPAPRVAPIPTDTSPQDQPPEEKSYKNLIFDSEFIEDGTYSALDPNLAGVPAILSAATDIIPEGGTTEIDAKMKVIVSVSDVTLSRLSADNDQEYFRLRIGQILVEYERVDKPPGTAYPIATVRGASGSGRKQDNLKPRTDEQKRNAVRKVTINGIKQLKGVPNVTEDHFKSAFG